MNVWRIGVVGQGFVGSSVSRAFRKLIPGLDVETYDKFNEDRTTQTLEWISKNCNVIFVCVPTPINDDNTCDTSIVESVLSEINGYSTSHLHSDAPTVVIKSTIRPGTTELLDTACENIDVIFNPEFLNARSAYQDFITQSHVILDGASISARDKVGALFTRMLPGAKIVKCTAREAEIVKYVKNCFFATKVSFANEMYQICQALNVEYTDMIEIAMLDDRMGWEHWRVPGPSPSPEGVMMNGFGGMCLPKDLNAFIQLAKTNGISPTVMEAAWNKNLEVRPGRDWERVLGVKQKE